MILINSSLTRLFYGKTSSKTSKYFFYTFDVVDMFSVNLEEYIIDIYFNQYLR